MRLDQRETGSLMPSLSKRCFCRCSGRPSRYLSINTCARTSCPCGRPGRPSPGGARTTSASQLRQASFHSGRPGGMGHRSAPAGVACGEGDSPRRAHHAHGRDRSPGARRFQGRGAQARDALGLRRRRGHGALPLRLDGEERGQREGEIGPEDFLAMREGFVVADALLPRFAEILLLVCCWHSGAPTACSASWTSLQGFGFRGQRSTSSWPRGSLRTYASATRSGSCREEACTKLTLRFRFVR